MLIRFTLVFLLSAPITALSEEEPALTNPSDFIQGTWTVEDAHFGDSNICFVHIGELHINGTEYHFIPDEQALISSEMRERFSFIRNETGNLVFQLREYAEDTYTYNGIVGSINFDQGEIFLVIVDLESMELRISSAVSEIELFQITRTLNSIETEILSQ